MSYFREKLAFVRSLADLIEEQADEIGRLRAKVKTTQDKEELEKQIASLTDELHRLRGGSYNSAENRRRRDRAIYEARQKGTTLTAIGRRYGITASRVHMICAAMQRKISREEMKAND